MPTADDLSNTGSADDEDGVATLPTVSTTSTSVSVNVDVTNSSGFVGSVVCYIDFNRDGDFTDTGEQSATETSVSGGTVTATFSGFAAPIAGDSYLRCRLATVPAQAESPTGVADAGEVEDYKILIAGLDYGDAPDTGAGTGVGNYETTAGDNGPSHTIVSGLNLGSVAPDSDDGTLQNAAANADDTNNIDDEDGVSSLPIISEASTSVSFSVDATNSTATPANLVCYIDFNRDGDFTDTGEQSATVPVPASSGTAPYTVNFSGFDAPTAGQSYIRCRLAYVDTEAESPTGAAASGEVEDFTVTIQGADYGDAPDTGAGTAQGNYETLASDNGPAHGILPGLSLGAEIDPEDGTLQNADADADDVSNTGSADDEDGVATLPTVSTTSTSVSVNVDVTNSSGFVGNVVCYIDFNRDGDFTDTGEQSATETSVSGGTVTATFSGFAAPIAGDSYLRCRLATVPAQAESPTGVADAGEVEDYKILIAGLDYGDAPDTGAGTGVGNYETLATDSGPNHVIIPDLSIGTEIDPEDGTLQNADADADDTSNTGSADDEDGISTLPLISEASTSVSFSVDATNSTGTPANLVCYVDFNRNGDFIDTGEQSATVAVPASSGTASYNVNFSGFAAPTPGDSYIRCRLAYVDTEAESPTGDAASGEVEDYKITIVVTGAIGNFVWLDLNADGNQNAGEPGIPNAVVVLYDDQGNEVDRAVTGTNGGYLFTGLPAGTYYVDVEDGTGTQPNSLPANLTQTPISSPAGADFGNQDHSTTGIPNTGFTGYPVTIGAGEQNLTADFGYDYPDDSATLGDRVWIDTNGDGVQDAGEPGLGGVTVTIYNDSDGNGTIEPGVDVPFTGAVDQNGNSGSGSTTTEPDGSYIFSNLPPDEYVVVVTPPAGYTQTGDPDDFGQPATSPDNQTTTPVRLAAGDFFPNADFGYQPNGDSGTIGDTVWFDGNANGTLDAGEPGIANVTVALALDANGNGTVDAGEIIASDTTDSAGKYLFTGLLLDDGGGDSDADYLVLVTDSNGALDAVRQDRRA